MSLSRREFLSGVKAELPILLGVLPFGLIYGVIALEGGMTAFQAQAMSAIVFAGSAQFIMAQLFALDTPVLVVIVTAFLVNLRHALYSASVSPYVKNLPRSWRVVLAYLLTDEAYAVTINHYRQHDSFKGKEWFFLGSGLALWTTWQLSTAAGILLGSSIPEAIPLDFFIALTFIALVVPNLADLPSLIAAVSAGIVSVIAFGLPFRLALVLGALVGIALAMIMEEYWPPTKYSKLNPEDEKETTG